MPSTINIRMIADDRGLISLVTSAFSASGILHELHIVDPGEPMIAHAAAIEADGGDATALILLQASLVSGTSIQVSRTLLDQAQSLGAPILLVDFEDGAPVVSNWSEASGRPAQPEPPALLIALLNAHLQRISTTDQDCELSDQLQKELAELRQSNTELNDFAYIVSHDLKEPLRGIRNYVTYLQEDHEDSLDDGAREKLETLKLLTQRLDDFINSLLLYSRVGRLELGIQDTDLNVAVEEVLESLRPRIRESGIEIRMPRPLPTIRCDSVRVTEVFRNLITNAIKYNDKAERWIEIGFRTCATPPQEGATGTHPPQRAYVYYIRDNGIGICAKHVDSVFKIFKRLHGRDKYGGGTGAGLTIAKKIVERHGGQIWIESEPDQGTTFFFTLSNYEETHAPADTQTDAVAAHRG